MESLRKQIEELKLMVEKMNTPTEESRSRSNSESSNDVVGKYILIFLKLKSLEDVKSDDAERETVSVGKFTSSFQTI